MKHNYRIAALSALLAGVCLAMPGSAAAFLNGAWASDADNCAKVFWRKGAQVSFADMSDVYGGGFIIFRHSHRHTSELRRFAPE